LGAWGAVQASAAGLAVAMGGVLRDVLETSMGVGVGYLTVYGVELILLLCTWVILRPLLQSQRAQGNIDSLS
jgi:BCD family chlorophyll transporter-like MFS transporter